LCREPVHAPVLRPTAPPVGAGRPERRKAARRHQAAEEAAFEFPDRGHVRARRREAARSKPRERNAAVVQFERVQRTVRDERRATSASVAQLQGARANARAPASPR
jgi:hypothetical protein